MSLHHSIDTNKHVAIAVMDRSRTNLLLVQQKESSKWGIPKGHLEKDERLWTAAVRELQEETNLSLKRIRYRVVSRNRSIYTVQLLEEFTELRPDPYEIEAVAWCPLAEVRADVTRSPDKYNMWLKIFFKDLL
jgi:8-oxo-dGTP pyrophosphatase MutT (NUDIX family)